MLAVTKVASGGRAPMHLRTRKLLPVPAPPVKKTFLPPLTASSTYLCSAVSSCRDVSGRLADNVFVRLFRIGVELASFSYIVHWIRIRFISWCAVFGLGCDFVTFGQKSLINTGKFVEIRLMSDINMTNE